MRKSLFSIIFIALFYSFNCLGQETFNRKHFIQNKIVFGDNDKEDIKMAKLKLEKLEKGTKKYNRIAKDTIPQKIVLLSKDTIKLFQDLSKKQQLNIVNQINLIKNNLTESIDFINKDGHKLTVGKGQIQNLSFADSLNPYFPDSVALKVTTDVKLGKCRNGKCKSNVLFEKDKLYVNPWNFVSGKYPDDKKEQYFKLNDGQTAKFRFKEITISTLTLPIKYRFRDNPIMVESQNEMMETVLIEREIPETFTTGLNISVFAGHTWGITKFHHRLKVGNITTTIKHTLGAVIGTATETLSIKNTDGTKDAPKTSEEFTIGLLSTGVGYVYSRNKIALGIFYGWDFGVGSISNTWNYDNRPWLGIGLGYDIFKL